MIKLSGMKPAETPTGIFWWPGNADEKTGIQIKLSFMSPNALADFHESIRLKGTANGKAFSEMAPATARREVVNEVLIKCIHWIKGLTFRKLQSMIPVDPALISASGGLDAEIPADPNDQNKELAEAARDNIIHLLTYCERLAEFVNVTSQNIGNFQTRDWEERAKN